MFYVQILNVGTRKIKRNHLMSNFSYFIQAVLFENAELVEQCYSSMLIQHFFHKTCNFTLSLKHSEEIFL